MKNLITVALFALGGCAANSGVLPLTDGEYMITKQAATGFTGTGAIKAKALREAQESCRKINRGLEIQDIEENNGPYVAGHYPRVTVWFRCTP